MEKPEKAKPEENTEALKELLTMFDKGSMNSRTEEDQAKIDSILTNISEDYISITEETTAPKEKSEEAPKALNPKEPKRPPAKNLKAPAPKKKDK